MFGIWALLLVAFGSVTARPDVSSLGNTGYQYNVPATSYGVPSGAVEQLNTRKYYHVAGGFPQQQSSVQISSNFQNPSVTSNFQSPSVTSNFETPSVTSNFQTQSVSSNFQPLPVASNFQTSGVTSTFQTPTVTSTFQTPTVASIQTPTVSSNFQIPIHEHSQFTGSSFPGLPSFNSIGSSQISSFPSISQSSFPELSQSPELSQTSDFSGSFEGSSPSLQSSGAHYPQQVEVQKHLYFFSAPDEPEEHRARVNIPVAPARKNVKIIFIKAPSFRTSSQLQIPAQPQNEEKTLVYVLVKRPDEQQEINIAPAPPTIPSKPEVYFIKYKTQKEAEHAIHSVQSGASASGASVSANSIEGDQGFVSSIGQDASSSRFGGNVGSQNSFSIGVTPGNVVAVTPASTPSTFQTQFSYTQGPRVFAPSFGTSGSSGLSASAPSQTSSQFAGYPGFSASSQLSQSSAQYSGNEEPASENDSDSSDSINFSTGSTTVSSLDSLNFGGKSSVVVPHQSYGIPN